MKRAVAFRFGALGATLVLACLTATAQVGVNVSAAAPNPRAMMDVSSTTKGLLIPRMTDAQRLLIPATNGLIVFQTNAPSASSPMGYWYYDANVPAWLPMQPNGNHWSINGNAGTNAATDYVGTSDAVDFAMRTNNVERLRMTSAGRVLLPPTSPATEALNITGAILQNDSSTNAPQKGNIIYSPYYRNHFGNVNGAATGWYQLENVFTKRVAQTYDSLPTGAGCGYLTPLANWPQIGTIIPGQALFSTIECPYSAAWEDGRHQYLYDATDFANLGICAGTDIRAVAFNVQWAGTYVNLPELKMKNTTTTDMTNFDYAGLQLCYSLANTYSPVVGWNTHTFNVSNFQWNGVNNVIIEFCINNYEWASNSPVYSNNTSFRSLYGTYCDACGGTGATPCMPTIPPIPGCPGTVGAGLPTNNWSGMGTSTGSGPGFPYGCGPGCNSWCSGYSQTPGCNHFSPGMSMVTCDGTFQWFGAQGSAFRHPVIKLDAQVGVIIPCINTLSADYLHSSIPFLVGTPAWAATLVPNKTLKGPGTLSAQVAVWGGITMLSDYVFDQYFDGSVRPEDRGAADFRHTPMDQMISYVERERHLPTMDGREDWYDHGAPSMDELTNQLWVTVEEQALYIKELNERMELLQKFLVEKRLKSLGRMK